MFDIAFRFQFSVLSFFFFFKNIEIETKIEFHNPVFIFIFQDQEGPIPIFSTLHPPCLSRATSTRPQFLEIMETKKILSSKFSNEMPQVCQMTQDTSANPTKKLNILKKKNALSRMMHIEWKRNCCNRNKSTVKKSLIINNKGR